MTTKAYVSGDVPRGPVIRARPEDQAPQTAIWDLIVFDLTVGRLEAGRVRNLVEPLTSSYSTNIINIAILEGFRTSMMWETTQIVKRFRNVKLAAGFLAATVVAGVLLSTASATASNPETLVYQQGFDTCETLNDTQLANWWNGTPNYSVGLYLAGGEDGNAVGCSGLSPSVWDYAWGLGYSIEAFWYGAQMPPSCGGIGGRPAYITVGNAGAAYTEGQNEATSAMNGDIPAYGLVSGQIVYLDLEGFANNSGCLQAAEYYVEGWDQTVEQYGLQPGLYGSSCASYLQDMSTIYPVPMAIAPSDPGNATTGVYGLTCLSDGVWNSNQRIHQTESTEYRTFNGTSLYVDQDCADGPVMANIAQPAGTACGAPY